MKKTRVQAIVIAVVVLLLISINASGGNQPAKEAFEPVQESNSPSPGAAQPAPEGTHTSSEITHPAQEGTHTSHESTEPSSEPTPVTPPPVRKLVPYDGIVEHLFFHEVIAFPELAFIGDYQQKGYDDNMVTAYEFNIILDNLYEKDYILVNMNDVWSEYTDDKGTLKMKRNTLMLPEGKKPIILSFDDISFYEYMQGYGFMDKLIVGDDGEIWAVGADRDGNEIVTQDYTAVTLLNKFIKKHPDFSHNGVKGCIALTGYEGILGYRTQTDRNNNTPEFESNRQREIAYARPVVKVLKDTGWYFASHSWGHINLNTASLERVKDDAQRWQDEVASLVGDTKLFIYPFGSRLDGDDVTQTGPAFRYYHSLGFRVFASVGIESFSRIKSDIAAVICDRMHADGTTLRGSRERYLIFYDAHEVMDPLRPANP